ncbi:MAG: hypothetical protein IPI97_08610 [Nitrosomonas sp.]|jgi:mevalonate kinase|nr:hypothetical protein [Nitrosomonas sp.]MBK7365039.1 hypothetical protein [Nitrosomonas sp.]
MEDQSSNNKQLILTESDVAHLIEQYELTCKENTCLKKQLAEALQKNRELSDKMEIATYRLEMLLSNLPTNKKQE